MAKRHKADKGRLEDLNQLTDQAVEITGKDTSKRFSIEDTRPQRKQRQPGLTAKNRAKFTTMLKPDLKEKLQNVADRNHMSIADVLEVIITDYFGLDKK